MEGIISEAGSVFKDSPEPRRPPALLDQLRHARPLGGWQHFGVESFRTHKWLLLVLRKHSELDDVFVSVVLVHYPLNVIHPGKEQNWRWESFLNVTHTLCPCP